MQRITPERFEYLICSLNGNRKTIVQHIGLGKKDQQLAQELSVRVDVLQDAVRVLFKNLEIGTDTDPYPVRRDELMYHSRKFFEIVDTPDPKSLPLLPVQVTRPALPVPLSTPAKSAARILPALNPPYQAPVVQTEKVTGEQPKVTPSVTEPEPKTGGPSEELVLQMAGKMKTLSPRQSEYLEALYRLGSNPPACKEMGISPGTGAGMFNAIQTRLKIFVDLSLEFRKELLARAWKKYVETGPTIERKVQEVRKPPTAPAVVKPNGVDHSHTNGSGTNGATPPTTKRESVVMERPISRAAPQTPEVGPTPNFSAGVVIPLPSDVIDLEIVVGNFDDNKPSPQLVHEINDRRKRGLKTFSLVLFPLSDKANIVRGQVVMVKRVSE